MSKVLYSIYRYIVLGLFLVINIWLFLLSIFSTSRLTSDASEHTYYTGDHAWLHIIILVVLIAAAFYLVRNNIFTRINSYLSNNEKTFIRIRNICLIIIGISGAAWVLLTQSNAGADQYYVLDAARGLRNGDYSAFRYNGYIAKYTNQIGLLFIEYIIGFIVGDYNYLFWQLLNVVMIVFTYKMFSDILGILKLPRIASLSTIILGILFFPWTLYSVFIYGNVAGLFFATSAFKYTMLFIDSLKEFNSFKISYIVISAVSMMLSVMVKNNYLIFMIALIIYTVAEALRHRNIQIILVTCAVIAGFACGIAMPSPTAVVLSASLARIPSLYFSLSKRFPAAILEAVLQAGHGLQWDFTHLMAMFMQTAGTAGVLLHFTRITITILRKKLRFLKQRLKVILTHIKTTTKHLHHFFRRKLPLSGITLNSSVSG